MYVSISIDLLCINNNCANSKAIVQEVKDTVFLDNSTNIDNSTGYLKLNEFFFCRKPIEEHG